MKIITRKEAKKAGLTRYFTGKPCKHGHISERQTSKGECILCKQIWKKNNPDVARAWNEANRERIRQWRNDNREHINAQKRKHYHNGGRETAIKYRMKNAEKLRQFQKEYHEKNRERLREYRQKNKARYNAHCRARQARQAQATPDWCCLESIAVKYKERVTMSLVTGIEHHVDHIVPLNHEFVCGLHVAANLRVIPARDNMNKSNKFTDHLYA